MDTKYKFTICLALELLTIFGMAYFGTNRLSDLIVATLFALMFIVVTPMYVMYAFKLIKEQSHE